MVKKGLDGFFEKFLTKNSLFNDKTALQSNYLPKSVLHRDLEIQKTAEILAPSLKLDKPSNLFIYGKTGTGKTLVVNHVTDQILRLSREKGIPIKVLYVNCKLKRVADTEYRLIAHFARKLGKEIPPTGLPTDEVYRIFFSLLDKQKQILLLVLDEIDYLIKKSGDGLLYNLTRINSDLKNSQVSVIGISNNLLFKDNLDPRIKSSLSEEELVFNPYNALQLQSILKQRSGIAFKENSLSPGVVEKCAAYAAREHGDARRAIELLRVAAEIADRNEKPLLKIEHLDKAEEEIERGRVQDLVRSQPPQHQAILYSIISVCNIRKKEVFTGEVYELYQGLCSKISLRPLTQRRVSDVIAEFDMLGIINTNVISKGRYGRTRDISLTMDDNILGRVKKILEESLNL